MAVCYRQAPVGRAMALPRKQDRHPDEYKHRRLARCHGGSPQSEIHPAGPATYFQSGYISEPPSVSLTGVPPVEGTV